MNYVESEQMCIHAAVRVNIKSIVLGKRNQVQKSIHSVSGKTIGL